MTGFLLIKRDKRIPEQFDSLAKGLSPGLIPFRMRTGMAPTVATPPFDPVFTAP
jgi:hypothetical protein